MKNKTFRIYYQGFFSFTEDNIKAKNSDEAIDKSCEKLENILSKYTNLVIDIEDSDIEEIKDDCKKIK